MCVSKIIFVIYGNLHNIKRNIGNNKNSYIKLFRWIMFRPCIDKSSISTSKNILFLLNVQWFKMFWGTYLLNIFTRNSNNCRLGYVSIFSHNQFKYNSINCFTKQMYEDIKLLSKKINKQISFFKIKSEKRNS